MAGRFWNLLCSVIRAGAVVALLTGSAFAQVLPMPGIDLNPDGRRTRVLTPEEKGKRKVHRREVQGDDAGHPGQEGARRPLGQYPNGAGRRFEVSRQNIFEKFSSANGARIPTE